MKKSEIDVRVKERSSEARSKIQICVNTQIPERGEGAGGGCGGCGGCGGTSKQAGAGGRQQGWPERKDIQF